MIFALRYGHGGQPLTEPWHAADSDYWRTPRTWHTWCRRCNRLVTHDTEAAAEADDQQHGCAAPRPQKPHWTPAEDGILVVYPPLEAARHLPGRSRGAITSTPTQAHPRRCRRRTRHLPEEGPQMKTCTFPDCGRPLRAKGWCSTHYAQEAKTGSTWAIGSRPRGGPRPGSGRRGKQGCAFDGCDRPHSCKGFCAAHYRQHSKGRELTPVRTYVKAAKARRKPTSTPTSTLPDGWFNPSPTRTKRAKPQAKAGDASTLDTDTLIAPQLDDLTVARARAVVISHGGTDLLDMLGLDAA